MGTPFEYFLMEASERLERLSSGLMELEHAVDNADLLSDLFRDAHSLKGAAGISGLPDVSAICHRMEDRLCEVRDGAEAVTPELIDALLHTVDSLQELIASKSVDGMSDALTEQIISRLDKAAGTGGPKESEKSGPDAVKPEKTEEPLDIDIVKPSQKLGLDTVRIHVASLETLANATGELLVAGDRLRQRHMALRELNQFIRDKASRYQNDRFAADVCKPVAEKVRSILDDFTGDLAVVEPLVADIHELALDTRMLPVSTLFDRLARFVRDHCRQENKEAELVLEGTDTRVDRQVLAELYDPVTHLIRNALSHGIESIEERLRIGKPKAGVVLLKTLRHADRISIICEDDGRGIDEELVLKKAVSLGLVGEIESREMTAQQIRSLILDPGFSTAEMITDVSGRGVGMQVVAGQVEMLRGTLTIESETGKFTRFIIDLPVSMATLEGLLVESAGFAYVIPTTSIARTAGIRLPDIQTCGHEAMANIEGQVVPLLMLSDLLGRSEYGRVSPNLLPAVVIRHRDQLFAVGVEKLLGTQIFVDKSLGGHLQGIDGVAGATILGTGLPALILDLGRLTQRAGITITRHDRHLHQQAAEVSDPILVIDDSITTRMMEQSILESAGYTVETAVDAESTLSKIVERTYRLFVVDVEMPGLNGFQLTRKIREMEKYANTPIIIVTSLAKEGHRREGLEAGANAYIVKGEFDQNNLLDTVERLVSR